jgi:hypothetical protein
LNEKDEERKITGRKERKRKDSEGNENYIFTKLSYEIIYEDLPEL